MIQPTYLHLILHPTQTMTQNIQTSTLDYTLNNITQPQSTTHPEPSDKTFSRLRHHPYYSQDYICKYATTPSKKSKGILYLMS